MAFPLEALTQAGVLALVGLEAVERVVLVQTEPLVQPQL